MVRTRLNIGCRYSTPVLERPLHPTRSQFKPQPSQTQAPVTPATEPERRAGGGLTTLGGAGRADGDGGRTAAQHARAGGGRKVDRVVTGAPDGRGRHGGGRARDPRSGLALHGSGKGPHGPGARQGDLARREPGAAAARPRADGGEAEGPRRAAVAALRLLKIEPVTAWRRLP